MRIGLVVICTLIGGGCVGSIYSERNPTIRDAEPFRGILFFQPIPVLVTYATNQLIAGSPKVVVGSAPDACTPVTTEKLEEIPDYTTPYRIYYEPGLLESGKFSVTLEQGVVKTVNSAYVPGTQELIDLTSAAAELAAAVGPLAVVPSPGAPLPPCNSGSTIVGIRPVEQLSTPVVQPGVEPDVE